MKKGIIIALSIVLLLLLIINMFRQHVSGVKTERAWYIKELGFQFSAIVDTVRTGHIRLEQIAGRFDFDKERRINEQLKYNGRLVLFTTEIEKKLELMIDSAFNYRKGDSVYVDCTIDTARVYRNKQLLSENALIRSIRGRPF